MTKMVRGIDNGLCGFRYMDSYSPGKEAEPNHKTVTQEQLIRTITPKIKGWANFFRHSAASHTFSLLDNKVFKLLWKWAKRRHPNKGNRWINNKPLS